MMTRSRRILVLYHSVGGAHPPYARMLGALCEALAGDGHRITILTLDAPHPVAGCRMIRLWALRWLPTRLRRYLFPLVALPVAVLLRVVGGADVVIAGSHPPVLNGLAARLAARVHGARLVYHLQDLHPEIASALGRIRTAGRLHRLLARIENATRRHAAACVTLTPDMARTITTAAPDAQVVVIPNPAPACAPAAPRHGDGPLRILYCGTLGRAQPLATLIAAVRMIPKGRVFLTIAGKGPRAHRLKRLAAGDERMRFLGWLPAERAEAEIQAADIGVLTLAPGLEHLAAPSKLLAYVAHGRPVLALQSSRSGPLDMVLHAGAGVHVANGTPDAIAAAIEALVQDRAAIDRMAANARVLARRLPTAANNHARWRDLLAKLEDRRCSSSPRSSSSAPRGRAPTCSAMR